MTAARQLFEKIVNEGYSLVEQLVPDRWGESRILDFKKAELDTAPMTSKDRSALAECLSGFANSEGGILFWGVHCRSLDKNDPDVAQSLKPINRLKLFLSDLERYTPQVVSPGIQGVEHHLIEIPKQPDVGFAVTYVPRTDGEPHMAQASKEQYRFYYRSGASFRAMETFMLADRYGRRPQPQLELDWSLQWDSTADGMGLGLTIGIKNTGLGLALYPALSLSKPSQFFSYPTYRGINYESLSLALRPHHSDAETRIFAGGVNDAIHPNTSLEITRLKGHTKSCNRMEIPELVTFNYGVHCQGFSMQGEAQIFLRKQFNLNWPE